MLSDYKAQNENEITVSINDEIEVLDNGDLDFCSLTIFLLNAKVLYLLILYRRSPRRNLNVFQKINEFA